jgi:predicted transposase YbfD/YdcC
VKQNQKQLLTTLQYICKYNQFIQNHIAKDSRSGGRQEIRKVELFAPDISICNLGYIYDNDWRKYIKTVIRVTRKFKVKYKGKVRNTIDVGYYISTTANLTAKSANRIIRSHWGIENCNHYVRDERLEEDKSRIRKNPGTMARIRSFALNLFRFKKVKNIRKTLFENCLDSEGMVRFVVNIG